MKRVPIRHNIREGKLIGWKKAYQIHGNSRQKILIKFEIPATAHVINAKPRKFEYDPLSGKYIEGEKISCPKLRASSVKVLGFYNLKGYPLNIDKAYAMRNWYYKPFKYELGKRKIIRFYNTDVTLQCSSGIHFYTQKRGAQRH